jgi:hypothetical protein
VYIDDSCKIKIDTQKNITYYINVSYINDGFLNFKMTYAFINLENQDSKIFNCEYKD